LIQLLDRDVEERCAIDSVGCRAPEPSFANVAAMAALDPCTPQGGFSVDRGSGHSRSVGADGVAPNIAVLARERYFLRAYSSLRRNSQAAALSVPTAMSASGTVFLTTSPIGRSLRNTPFTMTKK